MVSTVTAERNMYQAQTEKNSQSFFGLGWEKRYILVLAKAVLVRVQQVQRCSTISCTINIIRRVRKINSLRVVSVVVLTKHFVHDPSKNSCLVFYYIFPCSANALLVEDNLVLLFSLR